MAFGVIDSVGLGPNSFPAPLPTDSLPRSSSFSPRSAFRILRELILSSQFRDGVRLFAIGAAVSASKLIFDNVVSTLKRALLGEAIFRGRDEAYRWILLLAMTQPSFQKRPRSVEVAVRPTLLVDYQADYRGMLNEDEMKATWGEIQDEGQDGKDKETEKTLCGVHFFPATGESVSFVFNGTRFWISRQRDLVGDGTWDETIRLSYLSLSTEPLRDIIAAARDLYNQRSKGRVGIYRLDRYGNWMEAAGIAKRSVDSIYLPSEIKDKLLNDAQHFLSASTRAWYADRGIPYRRGYLLHGVPGSGKSSMVHVLASEIDRPIYTLNLAASTVNDETFIERMGEVPGGALLLLEDVDAAFVDRTATEEVKSGKKGGISFSTLLNALDGVGAVEGRLLCMTTNHVNKLDPALIRPGRVDMRFEFKNATKDQARDLFLRWYAPRAPVSMRGSFNRNTISKGMKDVQRDAAAFAEGIEEDSVSVATIQSFLLECGDNHARAVSDVATWMENQNHQKLSNMVANKDEIFSK